MDAWVGWRDHGKDDCFTAIPAPLHHGQEDDDKNYILLHTTSLGSVEQNMTDFSSKKRMLFSNLKEGDVQRSLVQPQLISITAHAQ